MTALQRVFRLTERGSFTAIKATQEEIPKPKAYEVLIKVKSVSLNYRDIVVAEGTYPLPTKDNVVPCSDAAGDIVGVGENVDSVKVGDRVINLIASYHQYGPHKDWSRGLGGPEDGVLREYIVLPAHGIVKIPESRDIDYAKWSTLVTAGVTIWNSFFGALPLRPGNTILLTGTGGVSMMGLVVAKAAGAVPIITSSSDEKLKRIESEYGVKNLINYRKTPEWAEEVLKITNGEGVDFILENGGSGTMEQSLTAVAQGGTINIVGFLSPASQDDMPDVTMLALKKACTVRGVLAGSRQLLEELVSFVARHDLPMPVDRTFGFSEVEIHRAFAFMKSGGHLGKVCISVP